MKSHLKRAFSGLLAAVMAIRMLPVSAFAIDISGNSNPYAPTGDFELNVAGSTAWNSSDAPLTVYKTESGNTQAVTINAGQTVTVNPEDTQTLVFLNEPLCSLTLPKLDSVTGKPVPGAEFTVKDGNGNVLGRYTTGKDGTVTILLWAAWN